MLKNNTFLLFFVFVFICLPHELISQNWQVGEQTITFTDPDRSNRSIPCEVYYPATNGGQNVPMGEGEFPHVVFGHGFVMNVGAYSSIAESLAEQGFIVLLVNTETGFSPSHTNFARDLAFVSDDVLARGEIPGDFFFGQLNGKFAIGGHSMGGGCTYLSVQYLNNDAACLFTFAAAETNPSAIAQMSTLNTPNLILAGELDCVTPPEDHQIPMYNDQSGDDCKYYVEIEGGYHCQFNDFNFNCNLGESFCSPPGGLTRAAQIELVLEVLTPWLKSFLFQECDSWDEFLAIIDEEDGITTEFECAIEIPAQPGIMINSSQPACPGDEVILEATETDGEIIWNTGEESTSIIVTEEGSFYYSLSSEVCQIESETVEVVYQQNPGYLIVSSGGNELCPGESIELFASPNEGDILWSTGQTGSSILINEPGTFSFEAELNGCSFFSEEFTIVQNPDPDFQVVAPQGSILCPDESVFLEVTDFSVGVLWNTGQSDPVIEVEEPGMYFYEGFVGNCLFFSDTLIVVEEDPGEIEIIPLGDTLLCPGDELSLVAISDNEFLWSTNEDTDTIVVSESGTYSFTVFTANCSYESELIIVELKPEIFPEVNLMGNPFLCPGDTAILEASVFTNELFWNTGSSDSLLVIMESGEYSYSLVVDGCTFFSDTIEVQFSEKLELTILAENVSELCEGDSIILQTSTAGIPALWSTGDSSAMLTIFEGGLYYYSIGDSNCLFTSDSLIIKFISEPMYELITDDLVDNCPGDSVLLKVVTDGATVIWNGDRESDSLWIFDSGTYSFDLHIEECKFFGEELQIGFRESWSIDSIRGADTVMTGEFYIFEVDFYDFLTYDWQVWGAEIVSGEFTNRIEIFIPEHSEENVELTLLLSDRLCKEKTVEKFLVLENPVSVKDQLNEPNYSIIDHGSYIKLQFSHAINNPQFILFDVVGRMNRLWVHQSNDVFQISKEGLTPGIYLLKIKSSGQEDYLIKMLIN